MEDMLELMKVLMVLGGIIFVAMMVAGVYSAKQAQDKLTKDDNKPEETAKGKILEKNVETIREKTGVEFEYTLEWIIFRQEDGTKRRLRNIVKKGIVMAVGDEGTITFRGETVYGFKHQ